LGQWVIRPVKIVSEMTYNVLSGTLSLYTLLHYYYLRQDFGREVGPGLQ